MLIEMLTISDVAAVKIFQLSSRASSMTAFSNSPVCAARPIEMFRIRCPICTLSSWILVLSCHHRPTVWSGYQRDSNGLIISDDARCN